VPGLPRQQTQPGQPSLPNLPNLPQVLPSVQVPEVRTSTGATTGACAVMTRQDAASALGTPVNEGKLFEVPKQNMGVMTVDISNCTYSATNGRAEVELELWKGPDANSIRLIASVVCVGKDKVSGIDGNVCWKDKEHREIEGLKGVTFVTLSTVGAPNENAVRDLAKKILDKV
jgi:hypothetical protein